MPEPQVRLSKDLCSLPFHWHCTLGPLQSLPEARAMVLNIHTYMLHMRQQAVISLLVLSIYFDRYWEVYNERLCFLTFYEALNCHSYFYSQYLTVWCWTPSRSQTPYKPMCTQSHTPTMPKWLFRLLPIKTQKKKRSRKESTLQQGRTHIILFKITLDTLETRKAVRFIF